MICTIAPIGEPRPDAPIYATIEAAIEAARKEQDERFGYPIMVIYDRIEGTPVVLVWEGQVYWR